MREDGVSGMFSPLETSVSVREVLLTGDPSLAVAKCHNQEIPRRGIHKLGSGDLYLINL